MELYVYDLVMFYNVKTTSVSLETIHRISNYNVDKFGKFHINRTNTYNFNDDLEVLVETYNIVPQVIVNKDVIIRGIWRFNHITKNYDKVYYEGE